MSEQEVVVSAEEGREDAGAAEEKAVSAGEAIRYRQQAERAEKELSELKAVHDRQVQELAGLKEESFLGEHTGSLLRQEEKPAVKTQGVKEVRGGGSRAMLEGAAKRAAQSGRRADLQEYLRARRGYV